MPQPPNSTTLQGYHGTNAAHKANILATNFKISKKDSEWLGHGAYFFLDGPEDPGECAKNWAIAESWNNDKKVYDYGAWIVLKATIHARKIFDLNTDDAKKSLAYARSVIEKRKTRAVGQFIDCQIINLLAEMYHFDVVIYDFYIKFQQQRKQQIESRLPNTRVMCVRDPASTVDKSSIRETGSGLIS